MPETKVSPHPLDDLSPENDTRSRFREGESLFEMAQRLFFKFPDLCILAFVILLDVLVLGPVTGYGWEPSRIFENRDLLARPFHYAWNNVDAIVFGFTSAQVTLLTIWACYSQRLVLTRVAGWAVAVTTVTVILMARMNAGYSTIQLLILFGWLCLGTILPSVFYRVGGWRLELELPGADKPAAKQFAIRELMLLSLLVGGLCAIAAVLARLSYSYYWGFIWREAANEYFWVIGIRSALIGCCSGFLFPFFARYPSNLLFRIATGMCICIGFSFAVIWTVEFAREHIYLAGGPPNYSAVGMYIWSATHFGLMASAVLVFRPVGLRALPPRLHGSTSPTSRPLLARLLRFATRLSVIGIVVSPVIWGLWKGADYYETYSLNESVSNFGTLANEPRNNGKWSVYLERPIDAASLKVLNENSSVTDLYIMSPDQMSAESLDLMKQLRHIQRIVSYNNSISPNEVAELASALKGVRISN
ncbi:MAG: hypothetical protein ACE361_15910 [Aureliella sp.]